MHHMNQVDGLALMSMNGTRSSIGKIDVLFVNTYEKSGGAARAAHRIFSEIRSRSVTAHYLTLMKEGHDPHVSGYPGSSMLSIAVRALARLDRIPLYFYPQRKQADFSPDFWPNPLRIRLNRFKAKLVHLHWVGDGFLGVEELAQLNCPIVWTLHDAWAFTGGCHYTGDCEGFKQMCGYCPQLGSKQENDYSWRLMHKKTKVFQRLDITAVAPSRWQAEMARRSSLFTGRRIEVIPNGLNTEVFKPILRQAARERLGIPFDKPVVLFGAKSITDPRKGWDLLHDALRYSKWPCTLIMFGEGKISVDQAPHVTVHQLGNFSDDSALAAVYSAADVFVCPSREDNLPNTVAEALACGTPCAAFAIHGLPDMIDHRTNGWLAKPFDSTDLAEGMRWLAEHPQPDQLRHAARGKALSDYSMTVMGDRYMALYQNVYQTARPQLVKDTGIQT